MGGTYLEPVDPLRRTDWRFLLPRPPDRPITDLVLIGGPDDLPELIEGSGIAARVTRRIPEERCADAVVVLDNSPASVRRAAGCLRAGGSLYCEFDRRSNSSFAYSPARLQRTLQKSGLSLTGAYWIRPDLIRRQVYVPVHASGPLQWYLRSLLTASSPAERILEMVLRFLARLGPRSFRAWAPCYALTAVAGPAGQMSPAVIRHSALQARFPGDNFHALVITQGKEDFKRLTVLPFADAEEHPFVVLKTARLEQYNEATQTEQEILRNIRSALEGAMWESIPQPLGLLDCGGVTIGLESVAQGPSIANKVNRWRAPLDQKIVELKRAADWITEFNRRVQIRRGCWDQAQLEEWVEKPFADYEREFGLQAQESPILDRSRRHALSLLETPLPTVWVHWDFSEYNIHASNGGITVLDWERGTPGPPLLDLLFFATIWSYSARNLNDDPARLRAFRRLFCESKQADSVSAVVFEVFDRYLEALEVDRRFLPLMLVIVCVKRALIHLHRRENPERLIEDPRRGNPYVDWLGVLAEDAEQLFQDWS